MKLTKRLLSGLLAFVMVLALCPVIPFAEEATPVEPVKVSTLGKTGRLAGRTETGSNVWYLSDLPDKQKETNHARIDLDTNYGKSLYVQNGEGTTKGVKTNAVNGVYTIAANGNRSYKADDLALGYNGVKFDKGLGVMPDPVGGEDRFVVYSTSNLNVDRFYAVVGGTGYYLANTGKSGITATFEVWGSTADTYTSAAEMEWTKLAYTEKIRAHLVAEFDVDITGYHYIKLVVRTVGEYNDANGNPINAGCELAWADACFYTSNSAPAAQKLALLGASAQNKGLAGKAENAKNIQYLSDLYGNAAYMVDQNNSSVKADQNYNGDLYCFDGSAANNAARKQIKAKLEADGTRTLANGITYLPTDIALGVNGLKFDKGLGVHPDAGNKADRYITFDVSSLGAERFYAVVGATGANITNFDSSDYKVTFEVWGGKYNSPASFTKLAVADGIRAYVIAEFDVDISGYDYIKLVTRMTDGFTDHSSCAVAWADACVYSVVDDTYQTAMGKDDQIANMTGLPTGITSQFFLSDLYHTPALVSKVAAERKVDGKVVHTGAMLNGEYSGNLYAFSNGARKQISASLDANGERLLDNGVSYKPTDIALGWNGTKYEKGLGVAPDAYTNPDRNLVFDVRGLNADYFYTVVGATGYNLTDPAQTNANTRLGKVEIWGSKGDSYDENGFVKLATVDGIRAYLVGEINVNIEGYNFIKLVWKMDDNSPNKSNASSNMAFGNACVYSLDTEKYVPDFTTSGTDKGVVDAGSANTQHTWTGVTAAEVEAYKTVLTNAGWTLYSENNIGNNIFATYVTTGDKMVHINYFGSLDNGRFQLIYGPDTWLAPKTELGSSDNIVTPSVTVLKMSVGTLAMVIQAADGTFYVIDGGYGNNGDKKDADGNPIWEQNPIYQTNPLKPASGIRDYVADMDRLVKFLEANKPEEHEKPQVYWMMTHAHDDHITAAYLLINGSKVNELGYVSNEKFDLKGIIYNFPNFNNVGFDMTWEEEGVEDGLFFKAYDRFVYQTYQYFPEAQHIVYHTGDVLNIAGGEIEFLYTPEDARPHAMPSGNHTCGVWRFNFDGGKSLMITGDAQQTYSHSNYANNDHLAKAFGDYLKSDMLQVIHHGTNGGSEAFYNAVDPSIAIYGQLSVNLDTDMRQLGTLAGFEFNKILRDGERVIYTCDETRTIYIPTVTYNDNGKIKSDAGLYSEAATYQGTSPNETTFTAVENFNTKAGHVFYGWATTPNGVVEYKAGEAFTTTESVTLYAVYAPEATVLPTMGKTYNLTGMTGDITKLYYLSDWYKGGRMIESVNSKVNLDKNYNGDLYVFNGAGGRSRVGGDKVDADGNRVVSGITYNQHDIALGYAGIKFEKGLGVHPNTSGAADRYIVYNVAGLSNAANYFYAVVGGTGANITNPDIKDQKVTFELWASKATENDADTFVKLASASGIRQWLIAEFKVDITGYNFIKLVCKMDTGANTSCAVAWGDAAVYSITEDAMGKDGVLAGKAENATNIQYLSDLFNTESKVADLNNKVVLDGNYNGDLYCFDGTAAGNAARKRIAAALDADGTRTLANGITYKPTDIAMGVNGVKFDKGLGVHPDAIGKEDRYITYDVSGLNVDRFYAVAGATGFELTDVDVNVRRVIFEVWGSVDGTNFTQLARADKIRAYVISEFDVDITGYNFIKLVVKMDPTSDANTSCAVAWGDACVYSTAEPPHEHTAHETLTENKVDATCGADGSYEEVIKCECGHEISRTPKVIPATGAHIYDEGVVTKEPTYTETGVKTYTCGTCGDTKTEDIPMLEKTVVDTSFTGKSLALEGAVTINLYVTYTVDGVTMNEDFVEANAGVLYWSVEDMPADRDAAILGTETHKADVKYAGVYQGNTEFFAMSHGIPAKCYGDTVYFRTYILVDGEYQYGEVEEYSILAYCENVFKNQNKPKLESALVALLNYGSAAQTYFAKTGETPVLVNAGFETYLENGWITADMLELSAADKVQTPLKGASAEMTVNFAQSGVMGSTSKSLALEGAIATNYYVAVTDHEALANAQSEKAYFWTEAKYNELQAAGIPLSKENASYVVDAQLTYSTRYGYEYFVASEQVPAPEWGNTQYMATVITDANGVDHCSGVITYSPLEYAAYLLNNGVANREDPVCEWLIAYSHRAIIALGR